VLENRANTSPDFLRHKSSGKLPQLKREQKDFEKN
jgi:hypothetical protein